MSISNESSSDTTYLNEQQSSPLPSTDELNTPIDPSLNNELEMLKSKHTALQSVNQQLQDENDQFRIQIEDLNQKIEELNALAMEQVHVIMENFNQFKSAN